MPVTTLIVLASLSLAVLTLRAYELPPLGQRRANSSPLSNPEPSPKLGPVPTDAPKPDLPRRTGVLASRDASSEITLRYRPAVQSSVQGYGAPGDVVTILQQTSGLYDSYQWYLVRLSQQPTEGWVRGDLIREQVAPEIDAFAEPSAYTREELAYFREIAFGNEFGDNSQHIRKWTEDITIRVHGRPTSRDRNTLDTVVNELNDLIGRYSKGVQAYELNDWDTRQASLNIYFVPHLEFSNYEPNYQPGNLGFAYVNWKQDRIYKGQILISTTDITQAERSHLIREELTQSLGLLQDSNRYEDSIFYQGWTSVTSYSAIDQAVIEMLYHPKVLPGMSSYDVAIALGERPAPDANGRLGLRGLEVINRLIN
ncbi:MAG: DUF2927 domain-containing protein [Elainellaceae cyanobacterium]